MHQLPQGRDARLRLFAQPLADLGLIGELAHPEEFRRQRILIEGLAVQGHPPPEQSA